MNLQDFNAQVSGNQGQATVLALYNDEFYDVTTVAVPVADAVVIVLAPETSQHPAVESMQGTPDLVSTLQGGRSGGTDTGISPVTSTETGTESVPKEGDSGTGSTTTSDPTSQP